MKFDANDMARRGPLWKALAELFLDTELDDAHYRYVARQVRSSGFTPREVREILWDELSLK